MNLRLVVIGGIRRIVIRAVRALAKRFDAQCVHHQLVVLLGRQLERGRIGSREFLGGGEHC